MWGTVGITYNVDMVKERLPNADLQSLDYCSSRRMPRSSPIAASSILESPGDVIPMVLPYLGKEPNTDQSGRFRRGRRGLQADPAIYQDLRRLELSERHSQQGTVRHQQLVGRLCDRQDARRGSRHRDQSRLLRAEDRLARLVRSVLHSGRCAASRERPQVPQLS